MPETSAFNEANYENTVVSLLESIGYTHLYGPDIERDYHNPLYLEAFTDQIRRINPKAHTAAIEEAVKKLTLFQSELRSAAKKSWGVWKPYLMLHRR
ncbi:hypothetical protein FACS189493_7600 [Spirochaetia bacterium]|nr:hypothetical protein FACS189493_7600 [Spirochaetia bacterium]